MKKDIIKETKLATIYFRPDYKAILMPRLLRFPIPFTYHVITFRAGIEFKLADFWIGLFWKFNSYTQKWDSRGQEVKYIKGQYLFNFWLCILPCIPVHFWVNFYRNSLRGPNE